jgi:hypothetical protein
VCGARARYVQISGLQVNGDGGYERVVLCSYSCKKALLLANERVVKAKRLTVGGEHNDK